MSDNSVEQQPIRVDEITESEMSEFIQARVKNHQCPVCLTQQWTFASNDSHVVALMALSKNGDFIMPPPSVPVAAVFCDHCGYIRMHALGLISQWKRSDKK